MVRANFGELVDDLQQRYAGRPQALARRAALIAALGYVGILLWLASIAAGGLVAFVGALYVPTAAAILLVVLGAVVLGVAIWQALELLWLRPGNATELRVRPEQAKQLLTCCDA